MRLKSSPRLLGLAAGGIVAAVIGVGAPGVPSAHADEAQPSIEETYDYPSAAVIEAQQGIKLIKGDGHILLADCSDSDPMIRVASRAGSTDFCFRVTKPTGYVTLELADVFAIRGDDHDVTATLTADDETETVQLTQDRWTPVGEATHPDTSSTLVELRASA